MSRTLFLTLIAVLLLLGCGAPPVEEPMEPAMVAVDDQPAGEYVRFADTSGAAAWGRVEGGEIVVLHAAPWAGGAPTGDRVARDGASLLAPAEPGKVIAIGLNYASHLGGREPAPYPGVFAKLPGSIVGPGDAIEMTEDAGNVHYEGELVLVVGKEARDVPMEQAQDYIFGVTAGNDVSERDWQSADLQWFRAKASDTYGPIGPVISRGVNYDDLELTTRLNGEVVQQQRTSDLIFDTSYIVSYLSRYVALMPGDLIFTGTPGTTQAMNEGDMVSVEVETVGVLENPVARR
ncbi:MAG: fumarylacetoacetate hydrolase family protein [Acidobacteriota bacterium]|nr:fumarylacetoacetate hydrolase family protein [Acidobacteriota bacterium]